MDRCLRAAEAEHRNPQFIALEAAEKGAGMPRSFRWEADF
jgi:hypothetical protein